ncbi:TM2 domain-containing protein [Ditylenchus destructor]|uniref:TM2 domain-containing protein n=1 Tax=Ditylenchus destructor TaxID=166010 RepID=A0AAD4NH63_9BILA|nr:TM2 domain-containing protein [Ditylenchus destructor]
MSCRHWAFIWILVTTIAMAWLKKVPIPCSQLLPGQYFCENPLIESLSTGHNDAIRYCNHDNSLNVTCKAAKSVQCFGLAPDSRTFNKTIENACTYSSGHNFNTALLLSVFFGWLGLDRIYLGYYAIGLLKLTTFGFFFVLYISDIILIGLHLLGPADGTGYANIDAQNLVRGYTFSRSNETSLFLYNCFDCI